ncbi:unnamed protein product [Brassica napus]|uniref:(rape) hypothetical protein n=1 Tax=Brassica napus TaxID=3708 RepID=A0A816SYD2_BRANA|nr:unnamed protein product [Brassica napus]
MARKSSGGWRLQSAFWGMVGDRFSLSDLVLLFSVREEERRGVLSWVSTVRCSSPGGSRLRRVSLVGFEPEYPPPSVVCAGGFLYHGGEFVSFSTQAGWCVSSVAGSRRSYGRFKERSSMSA